MYTENMQKMLSRTVTVGAKYAVEIFLGFLIGMCVLLALFLWQVMYELDFTIIAWIVVAYSTMGLIGAFIALSHIRGKYEQIQTDLAAVRALQGRLVDKYLKR